jgi:hypothetical protein
MTDERRESRLRQGAQGTLTMIALGLSICLAGLVMTAVMVLVMT